MRIFKMAEVIQRSEAEVFAFLIDTANRPLLIDGIASLDLVGERSMGAGSELRATRVFLGREAS